MDPVGGGIGKAAAELMKEMQQVQQQAQQMQEAQQTQQVDGTQFQQAMQDQLAPENVSKTNALQPTPQGSSILSQVHASGATPSQAIGQTERVEKSQVAEMLEGLADGQQEMNNIMEKALSGDKLSSQELLAMQAKIYRFTQEMEITSKVVEKSTSGLKQTMNTQV